jgi:hypothetical protein
MDGIPYHLLIADTTLIAIAVWRIVQDVSTHVQMTLLLHIRLRVGVLITSGLDIDVLIVVITMKLVCTEDDVVEPVI